MQNRTAEPITTEKVSRPVIPTRPDHNHTAHAKSLSTRSLRLPQSATHYAHSKEPRSDRSKSPSRMPSTRTIPHPTPPNQAVRSKPHIDASKSSLESLSTPTVSKLSFPTNAQPLDQSAPRQTGESRDRMATPITVAHSTSPPQPPPPSRSPSDIAGQLFRNRGITKPPLRKK